MTLYFILFEIMRGEIQSMRYRTKHPSHTYTQASPILMQPEIVQNSYQTSIAPTTHYLIILPKGNNILIYIVCIHNPLSVHCWKSRELILYVCCNRFKTVIPSARKNSNSIQRKPPGGASSNFSLKFSVDIDAHCSPRVFFINRTLPTIKTSFSRYSADFWKWN